MENPTKAWTDRIPKNLLHGIQQYWVIILIFGMFGYLAIPTIINGVDGRPVNEGVVSDISTDSVEVVVEEDSIVYELDTTVAEQVDTADTDTAEWIMSAPFHWIVYDAPLTKPSMKMSENLVIWSPSSLEVPDFGKIDFDVVEYQSWEGGERWTFLELIREGTIDVDYEVAYILHSDGKYTMSIYGIDEAESTHYLTYAKEDAEHFYNYWEARRDVAVAQ